MAVNYVYTDLSAKGSLRAILGGYEFEVAQYQSSWAANEVPTAQLMIAVGRNVRTNKRAKIHEVAAKLKQMLAATVTFMPRGQYTSTVDWPAETQTIFTGYFTGFAFRKVRGKAHVIFSLTHWLSALGFSSCLTAIGHVANPAAFNAGAVLKSGNGVVQRVHTISSLWGASLLGPNVGLDLWKGIKTMLTQLAQVPAMPLQTIGGGCDGSGDGRINTAALSALAKIEGPTLPIPAATSALVGAAAVAATPTTSKPYRYGRELALAATNVPGVQDGIALGIGGSVVESWSAQTFWDKLVGELLPQFGMAIVPQVDSAVVVADTPAYSGGVWKTVTIDDYHAYDFSRELSRPLRGVGVLSSFESQTRPGVVAGQLSGVGGCYIEDSVTPGDGTILFVGAPRWLSGVGFSQYNGVPAVPAAGTPTRSSTTPASAGGTRLVDGTVGTNLTALYNRYAHTVYVNNMLRGHNGSFSGKLRFDVAPLSMLRFESTTERHLTREDDGLASTLFGCVQRVTVQIDAESGMAGTSFQMSHLRTEGEYGLPRTGVLAHPLFGNAIHGGGKHGCPLVPAYDLEQDYLFDAVPVTGLTGVA